MCSAIASTFAFKLAVPPRVCWTVSVSSPVKVKAWRALVAERLACSADCWKDASNSAIVAVVSLTAEDCRASVRSCSSTVAASWVDVAVSAVILVTMGVVNRLASHQPSRRLATTAAPAAGRRRRRRACHSVSIRLKAREART